MPSDSPNASAKPVHDLAEQLIAIVCGLVLAWATVFLCAAPFTHQLAGARDFVVYWATGQQLVHHANPYAAAAIEQLERANGFPQQYTVALMRNPPWSLFLAWPLGWVNIGLATLFWTVLQTSCLAWTLYLLWTMLGRPRDYVFGLALSFSPMLLCLTMGQTTIFSALGLVLFLRYNEERPFVAGLALWLCLLKPQLFVPIGVVIVLWVILGRRYRVLAGAVAAMAASLALTYAVDPLAWTQYAAMLHSSGMELEKIPCFSVAVRLALRPKAAWAQYLLPAAASLWAIGYYWSHRKSWEWQRHGAPLMLASVVLAPYSWIYDQGLLLPALMRAAFGTRLRWLLIVLTLASPAILGQIVARLPIQSFWYLWPGALWIACYWLALRYPKAEDQAAVPSGDLAETGTISN